MATNDPVGTALAAIGAGATTGATIFTGGVLALRVLQAGGEAPPEQTAPLLTATMFAGIVAAAGSGWITTRAIGDLWRRGVTAAVSVFGAVLLAVAATMADQIAGVVGVSAYCATLFIASLYMHRLVHRIATS